MPTVPIICSLETLVATQEAPIAYHSRRSETTKYPVGAFAFPLPEYHLGEGRNGPDPITSSPGLRSDQFPLNSTSY